MKRVKKVFGVGVIVCCFAMSTGNILCQQEAKSATIEQTKVIDDVQDLEGQEAFFKAFSELEVVSVKPIEAKKSLKLSDVPGMIYIFAYLQYLSAKSCFNKFLKKIKEWKIIPQKAKK